MSSRTRIDARLAREVTAHRPFMHERRYRMIRMLQGLLIAFLVAPPVSAAEPLPALDAPFLSEEPAVAAPLVTQPGFFARWRADHRRRALEDGQIQTDRPSFTLSDSTVPKGWVQLESGWTFAYAYDSFPSGSLTVDAQQYVNALPELNLRIGVTSWAEVRVLWDGVANFHQVYKDASTGAILSERSFTDTANLGVGVKLQVSQQHGWAPKSAFVTELFLPTAGGNVSPLVDYIYTWQLGESFSLGGSTGALIDDVGQASLKNFFQSVIARYHYNSRVTWFCEYYGLLQRYSSTTDATDWYPAVDAGVQWRPLPNLQLDAKIGAPLGGENTANGVFSGAGVSVRY